MPAILNNTLSYPLGLNKSVYPSQQEHLSRGVCNLWGAAALSGFLLPTATAIKSAVDVASRLFPSLSLPANVPGKNLPMIGRPLNWAWKNPIKSSFITLVGSVANTAANFYQCGGHHLFAIRHYIHTNEPMFAESFDIWMGSLVIRNNILIENHLLDWSDSELSQVPGYLLQQMPVCLKKARKIAFADNRTLAILASNRSLEELEKLLDRVVSDAIKKGCYRSVVGQIYRDEL
ncbi:MAG: hypothetical protein S4CHLAM6_08080 [Chlamydiae bacterium]|nr:hypothetical protein [Chlamydiota bacterium]